MAVMMKKMGHQISGSDQNAYPPATDVIDRAKIKWFKKHLASNIENPDLVIIGNHIQQENPEAQEAIKRNLKIISLPELIGQIFSDKKRIVIAGTHGKTTTTSLISWILETARTNPSYLIGGIMKNTDYGFKLGKGIFFVVEGDEYRTSFFDKRPKFFHYKPNIAVLTTCELDHPDYFKNFTEVKKTFSNFLNLVPDNGMIVAGIDDKNVAEIFKKIKKPKISYGIDKKADYCAFDIEFGKKTKFKVQKKGKFFEEFEIQLSGVINVQNCLAGVAVVDFLGIENRKIKKALASFLGTKRRFEIVGKSKGITIIDDYAHHPTKIEKTLAASRTKFEKNKIYCIFEPHTYSRTKALISEYGKAFNQADMVIISKLMPARESDQKPTIQSKDVVSEIKKHNKNVKLIPESSEIIKYLKLNAKKGNVIIVMSVGGLNNLAENLKKEIKK